MNTKPVVLSLKVRRTRTKLQTNLNTGRAIPDSAIAIVMPDSLVPRRER